MIENRIYNKGLFSGITKQPLRNVLIYAPTIIWIQQGSKDLWWQENKLSFSSSNWLLAPANSYLTFINNPSSQHFLSKSLTFFISPPDDWQIKNSNKSSVEPQISLSSSLKFCFDMLYQAEQHNVNLLTQKQLVLALFAELKANQKLDLLFPSSQRNLKERLARYFSFQPQEAHNLNQVAEHFHMSPATIKRKLAEEGTSFRQILIDVRLSHSLDLFQQGINIQNVALSCGYQSMNRFSSRFKSMFGLTPKEYIKTIR